MGQILLLFIFSFFRLYQLPNSLFFFNDWGRDMLVLLKWQQTGLPAFGSSHQRSSFQQSAVYFYLLYPDISSLAVTPYLPFYLNHFYLIVLYSFLSFLKNSNLATSLLITFYLISVHPNYHPKSFCLEPIFYPAAYFCLYLFFLPTSKKYSLFSLWVFPSPSAWPYPFHIQPRRC